IDINLPDTEGTELLSKIHGMLPKARKVILTGYPTLENAVDSVNRQADAYIIKPVNPKDLLKVIAENMNKKTEADSMTEDKIVCAKESLVLIWGYDLSCRCYRRVNRRLRRGQLHPMFAVRRVRMRHGRAVHHRFLGQFRGVVSRIEYRSRGGSYHDRRQHNE